MKILKIFGVVVGIHIFALILIFANPGCSSTTKPPAAVTEAAAKPEPAVGVNVPTITPAPSSSSQSSLFNPDAPATSAASSSSSGGLRLMPTRPGSPVTTTPVVNESVGDVTPTSTYTVVSGDNLSKIAKKVHVTIGELAAANSMKTTATLRPGQKLLVPGKAAAASVGASSVPPSATAPGAKSTERATARVPGEGFKHTVKSGETLGGIARNYELRVSDIAVANNISDPAKIKPGQELIIPGWDKPGGKSGKSSKSSSASQKSSEPKTALSDSPPAVESASPPVTPIPVPVNPIEDNPIKPAPRP